MITMHSDQSEYLVFLEVVKLESGEPKKPIFTLLILTLSDL